jgi:hypothetical protein
MLRRTTALCVGQMRPAVDFFNNPMICKLIMPKPGVRKSITAA